MSGHSVFASRGTSAHAIAALGWVLTITACVVVGVVSALLLIALFRRRAERPQVNEDGEHAGRRWIVIGASLSVAILLGAFVYTLTVLTGYAAGLRDPALTLRIVGYRYWWKVEYLDRRGAVDFVTANEIHIPAGERVRLLLQSGDVIHSFWVPALAGKTDLIPGQTNRMWIEADSTGEYDGQCAEYCGPSHANMRIEVFADAPGAFAAWEAAQRRPAVHAERGMAAFQTHGCAACHTIAGTSAHGEAGPDLTHVGSRTTLAAGVIRNTPRDMARWLARPDSVKPGALMPNTGLTPPELSNMVAFLESLK